MISQEHIRFKNPDTYGNDSYYEIACITVFHSTIFRYRNPRHGLLAGRHIIVWKRVRRCIASVHILPDRVESLQDRGLEYCWRTQVFDLSTAVLGTYRQNLVMDRTYLILRLNIWDVYIEWCGHTLHLFTLLKSYHIKSERHQPPFLILHANLQYAHKSSVDNHKMT